jgi:adenylate cyclase
LTGREDDVRQPRRQRLSILFVDIVGFTRLCERAPPERVVALLRGYHDRVGEAVFAHGGSIDKYIGDGLMATFGTPLPLPAPASSALNCALAIVAAVENWNEEREERGMEPIHIGIGLHVGEAIVGDGNARRLEFAVIGDVVNVASRIEHLTRELRSPVAVSGALVAAARAEGTTAAEAIARLRPSGSQALRGRLDPIDVWVLDTSERARRPGGGKMADAEQGTVAEAIQAVGRPWLQPNQFVRIDRKEVTAQASNLGPLTSAGH